VVGRRTYVLSRKSSDPWTIGQLPDRDDTNTPRRKLEQQWRWFYHSWDRGTLWIVSLEDEWAFPLEACTLTGWQPLGGNEVCPLSGAPIDLLTYEITDIPLKDHGDTSLYQALARLYETRAQSYQLAQPVYDLVEQAFPFTEEDLDWYETQWFESSWD
jgi:hypothetical protein